MNNKTKNRLTRLESIKSAESRSAGLEIDQERRKSINRIRNRSREQIIDQQTK
ncbi:hypothetical protein [Virgibacillus byunsanensis]